MTNNSPYLASLPLKNSTNPYLLRKSDGDLFGSQGPNFTSRNAANNAGLPNIGYGLSKVWLINAYTFVNLFFLINVLLKNSCFSPSLSSSYKSLIDSIITLTQPRPRGRTVYVVGCAMHGTGGGIRSGGNDDLLCVVSSSSSINRGIKLRCALCVVLGTEGFDCGGGGVASGGDGTEGYGCDGPICFGVDGIAFGGGVESCSDSKSLSLSLSILLFLNNELVIFGAE